MTIMKKEYADLKKKDVAALDKELKETHLELIKLRAQLCTGAASKEVGKLHNLKKKIARIETLRGRTKAK